jgi:hypothetical protein
MNTLVPRNISFFVGFANSFIVCARGVVGTTACPPYENSSVTKY